uniref:Uncharacterized protein n=1 Tax=Physcomitrium patens TaxID=3218 RepID=A0A2K1IXZ9_PHYPA|nr:hypothetical protein PHYPA_023963 [Physcomitrium patens]
MCLHCHVLRGHCYLILTQSSALCCKISSLAVGTTVHRIPVIFKLLNSPSGLILFLDDLCFDHSCHLNSSRAWWE